VKLPLAAAFAALAVATPVAAAPPRPAGDAYLVQNGATGEVLASDDARERVAIASITKLMTALVALERLDQKEVVTVRPGTAAPGEASARLRAGERLTVADLVEAALVHSANDAARALAIRVAGTEAAFARLMNSAAAAFGMRRTHFVNATGLDAPGHVSTTWDVTLLARRALRQPLIRRVVAQRNATIAGGRTLHGWNDLLGSYPGVIGVKTGHTTAAGWSQVAAVRAHGFTIYATILGSPSRSQRNSDLRQLLAWGVARYRVADVVRPGRVYARARTEFGRAPVAFVPARGARAVVRVDRPLREVVVAPGAVRLPVRKGEPFGRVEVWAGKKRIAQRTLVAARAVERPGFFGRVAWYAGRTVSNAVEFVR
jgi:D-alanyl-D-alanine carboxypeptidase (penicillin-binding protein 5/6)